MVLSTNREFFQSVTIRQYFIMGILILAFNTEEIETKVFNCYI